ncbi:MAG: hypothetical protein V8S34_04175 [Lawsonibacter sp.]
MAGTHGKTTTTSMCAHIFLAAQRDPSIMIGGVLALGGRPPWACRHGEHHHSGVLRILQLLPVLLPHRGCHPQRGRRPPGLRKDLEDVKHSFRRFAELVPETGFVVADRDAATGTPQWYGPADRPGPDLVKIGPGGWGRPRR